MMMTPVSKDLEFTVERTCTNVKWRGRDLDLAPQQRTLLFKLSQGPLTPADFGDRRGSTEVAITRLRQCLSRERIPVTITYANTGKWRLESMEKKARPR
jgi:hypothetical protein